MKWWNRLTYRLTAFVLLLAVVPLAGVGVSTIKDIRQVRLQSIAQIHGSLANDSANRIEANLTDTVKKIQLIIESNELEAADVSDQEWILQMLIKALPHLDALKIVGPDGRERVKVGRDTVFSPTDLKQLTDIPVFPDNGEANPIVGNYRAAKSAQPLFDLYIPVLSPIDRHTLAVLVAEIDIEKLLNFTAGLRLGKTGYVYVVNDKGTIFAYPDHSVVLAGEDAMKNPVVNNFVLGRSVLGTNQVYTNRANLEVLTNGRTVKDLNLLVVVEQSVKEALATVNHIIMRKVMTLAVVLVVAILLALYFVFKLNRPLRRLASGAQLLGTGDLAHRIAVTSSDELGAVTQAFNGMAEDLETARKKADQQNWIRQGVAELDERLRGDLPLQQVCTTITAFMAGYLMQQVGLIYVRDGNGTFRYGAGYAFKPAEGFADSFRPGEGLPGQAVLEKKMLIVSDIPAGYISVTSGLGTTAPEHLSIVPFVSGGQVEAVMELGSLKPLTDLQKIFLGETADNLAIIIAAARSREQLDTALVQSRQQAEELQRQQEELQAANEEMEEQTQLLTASESQLKEQQEELQAANEELEEKTQYLERHKKSIEEKNRALESMQHDLENKARDLAIASKYKSEFLANMSHELRTPLNSLLLLARLLADNKKGNLSPDQVDSARIICSSGNDLLDLINEILDLSKIEAGKMQLSLEEIPLRELCEALEQDFSELAKQKGLSLDISINATAPEAIVSDQQRLLQILRNFMSNALKFTPAGGITVEFYRPEPTTGISRQDLAPPDAIAVDVRDTGIGISEDKQKIIFEAFQQVESGSARQYGGTGLGLSISRELANLLGGEVHLRSQVDNGSTFTLLLPIKADQAKIAAPENLPAPLDDRKPQAATRAIRQTNDRRKPLPPAVSDDRDDISPEDDAILIIEDDVDFAATLLRFCREKGFKGLVSHTGEDGLVLADTFNIKAIILDIHLPGIDGWAVLEALKENPSTRHIPVHFMSADEAVPEAFAKGAIGYLTKPVTAKDLDQAIARLESIIKKEMKDLLLVEDDANQRHAIAKLISDNDLVIREASTGQEAINSLRNAQFDCMILDLGLPDMSGFDLLKKMEKDPLISPPPVVVYTGRDLKSSEDNELRQYSESIIIKGVRSEERLLDETALFLHRVVDKMPEEKRKIISALHDPEQTLQGHTVLIVDDDMRNVFALSKALQARGVNPLKAENGIKALEILNQGNDVDLVLMDIMMPVMDGYATMKRIRAERRFSKLPIIALTAKAMQRDKEDCIAAGANDYLAKPVEIDRLLSMMRVWLYR